MNFAEQFCPDCHRELCQCDDDPQPQEIGQPSPDPKDAPVAVAECFDDGTLEGGIRWIPCANLQTAIKFGDKFYHAATIAALQFELAKMTAYADKRNTAALDLQAELAKLTLYKNLAEEYGLSVFADMAALTKDAERYRWLRTKTDLWIRLSPTTEWTGGCYPAALDEAIDDALEKRR